MIRDTIKQAQIDAMKGGDKERLAAVRLILAKLKDRDIELRTASQKPEDDALVVETLQKMAKQRRESITMYVDGNREELAEQSVDELTEVGHIDAERAAQLIMAARAHWFEAASQN